MSLGTKYRLHASLGYQLSLTSRVQEKHLDEKLKSFGLNRTIWCVLLAVENEGISRPSEIATFVGIDRSATSRALKQMEQDGLIVRQDCEQDRRSTNVTPTERGTELVRAATPEVKAYAKWLNSKLDRAEAQELRRILTKLRAGERIELDRI